MNHIDAVTLTILLLAAFGIGAATAAIGFAARRRQWAETSYDDGRADGVKEGQDAAASQLAQMTETQRAYYDIKPDVDEIAMFLRERYKDEINLGHHAGRKLGAIVTGYLAVERKYNGVASVVSQKTSV